MLFLPKLKESIKHTLRMRTKNANEVISERLFGLYKCGQSVILHEVLVSEHEASIKECYHIVHGIQCEYANEATNRVSKVSRMSSPAEKVEVRICAQSRLEHLSVLVPPNCFPNIVLMDPSGSSSKPSTEWHESNALPVALPLFCFARPSTDGSGSRCSWRSEHAQP